MVTFIKNKRNKSFSQCFSFHFRKFSNSFNFSEEFYLSPPPKKKLFLRKLPQSGFILSLRIHKITTKKKNNTIFYSLLRFPFVLMQNNLNGICPNYSHHFLYPSFCIIHTYQKLRQYVAAEKKVNKTGLTCHKYNILYLIAITYAKNILLFKICPI